MLRGCLCSLAVLGASGAPARRLVPAATPAGSSIRGATHLRTTVHLVFDDEPVIVDASVSSISPNVSVAGLAAGAPDMSWPTNSRNGTPWFRVRRVSGRGTASHEHFGGLAAEGDFQQDVIHAHNVVRQRAGLPPLGWSEGLSSLASARVHKLASEGCYIQHSALEDRWEASGFQYVGENLYKVINMAPTGIDVVDAWYAEIADYSYGPVGSACTKRRCLGRSRPPCALGHFTQVMWQETTHLGCGVEQCPGTEKPTFIAVCHYGPGGNIVGHLPFLPQAAASLGFGVQACEQPVGGWPDVPAMAARIPDLHNGAAAGGGGRLLGRLLLLLAAGALAA